MKVQTYCPVFPGFDHTIFSFNEELLEEEIEDVIINYDDYENRVGKEVLNKIEDKLNTILPGNITLQWEKIFHPQAYNYTNDAIYCTCTYNPQVILDYIQANREAYEKYWELKKNGALLAYEPTTHDLEIDVARYLDFILENEKYDSISLYYDCEELYYYDLAE